MREETQECEIYWPKEFTPHLYFFHIGFNTKTVIFVLPKLVTGFKLSCKIFSEEAKISVLCIWRGFGFVDWPYCTQNDQNSVEFWPF